MPNPSPNPAAATNAERAPICLLSVIHTPVTLITAHMGLMLGCVYPHLSWLTLFTKLRGHPRGGPRVNPAEHATSYWLGRQRHKFVTSRRKGCMLAYLSYGVPTAGLTSLALGERRLNVSIGNASQTRLQRQHKVKRTLERP
jgi:hypothetical protein